MNILTLVVYLSSILSGVVTLLILSASLIAIYYLVVFIFIMLDNDSVSRGWSNAEFKPYPKLTKPVVVIFFLLTLSALIPSQETVYLMFASEVGEEVIQTEEAREVFNKLNVILDNKLESLINE